MNISKVISIVLLCLFSLSLFSYLPNIFDKKSISVISFGDVMLDRGVRNIMEKRGRDPFEYIKKNISILERYDFVSVNLEGPIVEMDRSLCQQKIYNFQFASNTPQILKKAGINTVNIANNHSLDCFKKGFESTKKYLSDSGIYYMGDIGSEKSYFVKEINKKKIAFIGIDAVTLSTPLSGFYPVIGKLKKENDYVVVNIHWGEEYNLGFTKSQESIGHKLIDSGSDVVFGHHPHVVEPVEIYKNGLIFYSLGNFVFDQDFGRTNTGLGVGVEFFDDKRVVNIYPLNIKKFVPDFMNEKDSRKFCKEFLKDIRHQDCSFEIKL